MTRTTTDGSTTMPPYRFTAGYPDAINTPAGGNIPGNPPIVFMTGGDLAANSDPALIGADRILNAFTDNGYTVCQCHVPMGQNTDSPTTPQNVAAIGNDASVGLSGAGAMERIADTITYARANLGATMDPPIILGISNGWVCGIIYARQYAITGLIGILPVVDTDSIHNDDAGGLRKVINYEWQVASVAALPARARVLNDAPNYPDLFGKVQAWYSGNDEFYVAAEMSFLTQIRAEQHNLGAYGHLGTFNDATYPCDHVDITRMIAFVNECIANL